MYMKRIIRSATIILISLTLALTSAAISGASAIQRSTGLAGYSGTAFFFQTTTTPELEEGGSEVGSTDGITLMGFIIVAIIVLPIVLQRKNWSQS